MVANPLVRLGELGQSPWLDFITRDLVRSGELARLIAVDGVKGMTTNPTIFEKAVTGSDRYDEEIRALAEQGFDPARIVETLAVADVRQACDAFQPVYQATGGEDGFVSLEVPPELAFDAEGTLRAARRLWAEVGRRNLMIKIPGTGVGLTAVERALTLGINVNVTLLFSVERYRDVIAAYLAALEWRVGRGDPVDTIASVASFFVSRVDGKIDALLDARGDAAARTLRGAAAIANARIAYAEFESVFRSDRWHALARRGARVQRPLWASTSTKDPAYSDVLYVESLVAPLTVTTLPPETLAAYRDHGRPAPWDASGLSAARDQLRALAELGIDLGRVTRELETEGVGKFAASHAALLTAVETKAAALSRT